MKQKEGLTEEEAKEELKKVGLNEIKDLSKVSVIEILLRQVKGNLVFYLLFVAMVVSFLVGDALTGYSILAVLLIVIGMGFIQEYRAEKVIESLKSMLMPISIVLRDGKEKEIPSKEIVPGDIIILRSGEKIPADCVVLEEKELLVNESVLTGESVEVEKKSVKIDKDENEKEYSETNMIFMGCYVVDGKCTAKVIATGMNTRFGKIAGMISTAEKELPLQNKVNKISAFTTYVSIVFCIITGIIILIETPFSEKVLVNTLILMIALAVSAFPEGLPVVLVSSLSIGAYRMAKQNAIVNRMSIIETLGETTVICSDKTGTITKGEMTVKKIFQNNSIIDVSGTGYEGKGEFLTGNKKIKLEREEVLNELMKCAVLCNDSKIERTGEDNLFRIIGSPTEASLLIMAAKAGIYQDDIRHKRIQEIPFNSERKIMSVLCKLEEGNFVYSKGALELVLNKCKKIQKNSGIFRLTDSEKKKIIEINKGLTSDCFRTLALAYRKIDNENKGKKDFDNDLVFLGIAGIEDPPREEVKEAVRLCLNSGIQIKMITGDDKETALAISRRIGLIGKAMEGKELDMISEEELAKIVSGIAIFARVKPEHKIKIVKALKLNGEIVTMTGDGVNDAPALKESHIGVAMGKNGTDVSRSVADLTLKDDNFATIVSAIREGRTIFKNIRKFVSYQLSCSWAELMILLIGVSLTPFLGWTMPLLLAMQILFLNLVTDDVPAISLALTSQPADIMDEKPRKKKDILNKHLIFWFVIGGILMSIITLFVLYLVFNILHQDFTYARTTTLLTLIVLEGAAAYTFTSFRHLINFKSLIRHKYLSYATLISAAATIAIIYIPLFNRVFGTVPLGWLDWAIALAGGWIFIFFYNVLKRINNKKQYFHLENF